VYLLSAVYFAILVGAYALSFWVPTMIKALGIIEGRIVIDFQK
jgi:hypothetical protein